MPFSVLLSLVFSTNYPARAAYQVAALPRVSLFRVLFSFVSIVNLTRLKAMLSLCLSLQGGLVEIEAVAVLGPLTDVS